MTKYVCASYMPGNLSRDSAAGIDFKKITHVFIAFATLREENGLYLPFVRDELRRGVGFIREEIRAQGAHSLILLSVGGGGADLFCEASSTDENRAAFAESCAQLAEELGLDGIDMDWEFPGMPHAGISACEHCVHDFTLLCGALRGALGKKLLTSAMGSDHWNRLENARLNSLLDLVNIMTYDMNNTAHSSFSLTAANMEGWEKNGIDKRKLVLGVPFYCRCEDEKYEWRGYSELMTLVREGKASLAHEADQDYVIIDGRKLSIDTPESIRRKVEYVKKKGFAGIFNWQELTDYRGELRDAMFEISA